jgi:transposase
MAAFSLTRSRSALGAFYRRLRSRLGAPKAITATAHKIAQIFYKLWLTGGEYSDPGLDYYEQKYHEQILKHLQARAAALGLEQMRSSHLFQPLLHELSGKCFLKDATPTISNQATKSFT